MNLTLSTALGRVPPSASTEMAQAARDMRSSGIDVVSLSIGQPDFDTPEHIKRAAWEAMERADTGYPPIAGTPALREAIVANIRQMHKLEYAADNVLVANGAKQVLFNALIATLDPGDEVIIPAPYWVSYPDIVSFTGASSVIVPTRQDDNFILGAGALEAAITPRTRWLMLNSPGNPTGSVYDSDTLQALAEVLMRHPHVGVITDDIYQHLTYSGRVLSILEIEPGLVHRTLLVNGVSKAWCMTGWRIGWGAGPRELIRAMTRLQSQSTSGACSISQAAAVAALTGDQSHIPKNNIAYQARRDHVVKRVNEIPGLSCRMPDGAFYVYIDCSELIGRRVPGAGRLNDDRDITNALLEHAHVATVHGAAFGLSPYVRASYATDMNSLDKALDRIGKFCAWLTD